MPQDFITSLKIFKFKLDVVMSKLETRLTDIKLATMIVTQTQF